MSVLVEDINLVGLCRTVGSRSMTCTLTYKADHYKPACLGFKYCQTLSSFY